MSLKIKLLHDRILVKPLNKESKTENGIIVPDKIGDRPLSGQVVAVGPGNKNVKMTVSIGDKILYGKFAGTDVEIDGIVYLAIRENDVIAKE